MEVQCFAVLQDCYCTFEVALVFVHPTRFLRVDCPSLPSECQLPTAHGVVNVLADVVEKLDKAHLARHVGAVVVDCVSVDERVLLLAPSLTSTRIGLRSWEYLQF